MVKDIICGKEEQLLVSQLPGWLQLWFLLICRHFSSAFGTCAQPEQSCQQGVGRSFHIVIPVPIRKSPGLSESWEIWEIWVPVSFHGSQLQSKIGACFDFLLSLLILGEVLPVFYPFRPP